MKDISNCIPCQIAIENKRNLHLEKTIEKAKEYASKNRLKKIAIIQRGGYHSFKEVSKAIRDRDYIAEILSIN